MKRIFYITSTVVILSGVTAFAQLSQGGSAGKGSPMGPASATSTSSSDAVRNSGIGSTVNRPVDNAPKSQAPDTTATRDQGLEDQNAAASKMTPTEKTKTKYLETAQVRLNQLDSRVQTLDNLVNAAPDGIKSRLKPLMVDVHDRRDQARSLVDKINGDNGRQFSKDKLHLDTALNDLESRLRDSERKFNK
jgi:hypothetical protein